ncbi:putative choline kinase [Paramyrothecium foliicola]|nr:putative choline kinase [Paramyrothecium foliicola]
MSAPNLPNGAKPLRSAMKSEDDSSCPASCNLKAVQIAEPVPETPLDDEGQCQCVKKFRATTPRRLGGKSPSCHHAGTSSVSSLNEVGITARPSEEASPTTQQRNSRQYYSEKLLAQVGEWLERERKKKAATGRKKSYRRKSRSPPQEQGQPDATQNSRTRSDSIDSDSSDVSLDRLQRILEDSMTSFGLNTIPQYSPKFERSRRRRSISQPILHRSASSDTDYSDGDVIVPSCDAWLDNSKTMSYTGGAATSNDDLPSASSKAEKEQEAWLCFKNEIIRIAHTLKLKGWRRISLGSGDSITVERLSGALTNAVYVVTPPSDIQSEEGKKMPTKVLLRVYGPQAEHLIDRENELQVLQRLARKKIGPRLLGTFQNGRFEQFFNAITLTPSDLRDPETSRQIAKRMRELHDGIDVLQHERDNGPSVWRNWDQWQDNVTRIATFLDRQLERSCDLKQNSRTTGWMANGYVCGVPWEQFQQTVMKCRAHIISLYKHQSVINNQLVFAHNDTQYGNILRIRPDDEKSPLLQPANKHKQLVVIDFEYAAANHRGLEFANHFTEWTYNYHDPVNSHACTARRYPTVEEQRRFVKAYVDHRPRFTHPGSTPRLSPLDSTPPTSTASTPLTGPVASSSSIADFMLDARAPPGGWNAAERAREEQSDQIVQDLMNETRLWRPINSAFWISWGIVQAEVPGVQANGSSEDEPAEAEEPASDEFDYLSYAQDRAFFFWGDCVQLGIVKLEELPERLQSKLKIIEY